MEQPVAWIILREERDARQVPVEVQAVLPDGVRLTCAHIRPSDAVCVAGEHVHEHWHVRVAPATLPDEKRANWANACVRVRAEQLFTSPL